MPYRHYDPASGWLSIAVLEIPCNSRGVDVDNVATLDPSKDWHGRLAAAMG
jgi:hypothetical protein